MNVTEVCGWCADTKKCSSGSVVGPSLGTCNQWEWEKCTEAEPEYTAVRILLFVLVILAVMACFGILYGVYRNRKVEGGPTDPESIPQESRTKLEIGEEISYNELEFEKGPDGLPVTIGRGGAANVLKGKWRGTEVAIKVMFDSVSVEEFQREVNSLRQLRHPNILQFFGACTQSTKQYIITPYVSLGSLDNILHDTGITIHGKLIQKMLVDVVKGMMYLHSYLPGIKKPIIHRDLKPSNLLVISLWEKAEVNLVIADFGLSKESNLKGSKSIHSMGVGTIIYMAPEVISGKKYSRKVDVYSWAVIMWEMITRQQPFKEAETHFAVERAVLNGERPPMPPHLPKTVSEIITTCWATKPDKRPEFSEIFEILNDPM